MSHACPSLPTLSLQNDFASKTRSRNRSRKLIARSRDTLGCVPPIRRLRLLSASRPLSRTSSFNILTSATHSPRKSFLLRTYEKRPCNHSIMNTSGTENLKSPAMNTYRKIGGGASARLPARGARAVRKSGGEPKSPARSARAEKSVGARAVRKSGCLWLRSAAPWSRRTHDVRYFSMHPRRNLPSSYTYALLRSLFCTCENINPCMFNPLRTLCRKILEVGGEPKSPARSARAGKSLGARAVRQLSAVSPVRGARAVKKPSCERYAGGGTFSSPTVFSSPTMEIRWPCHVISPKQYFQFGWLPRVTRNCGR